MDPLLILGILIALALCGAVAEFAARWYLNNHARPCVWRPHTRLHMKMDQDVLPELEELVRSEVNSLGERGEEPPDDNSTYRILVIGGSAAECFYLDKDSGWPGVVAEILNQPENLKSLGRNRVHLGNIARAGVGSVALRQMLEMLLPHYERLDLILCMVGASDVLRWFARGAPGEDEEAPIRMSDYVAFIPRQHYSWHPRGTAVAALLRHVLKSLRRRPEVRENTGRRVGSLRKMRSKAPTLRTETGDPAAMLDRFEDNLRQVAELCRRKSERLVMVRQPWFDKDHTDAEKSFFWNAAQGDPFREECDTYFDTSVMRERMRDMDSRVVKVCEDLDIEHIDLLPHLEMSRRTFYDFFHYTPEGARRLGEVVAEHLMAAQKLSERQSPV